MVVAPLVMTPVVEAPALKTLAPACVLKTCTSFAEELDHQDWPEVVPLLRRGHTETYEHDPVPW